MKYRPIIGLEVHVQPKTKSKMFCACDADYFGTEPNSHTCPVCLGLPGALPVPNRAAIESCIKLALALNCEVNSESKFDRKNYFYPDLPKGYQISQYDQPIGEHGFLEIDLDGDAKRLRITRVHVEEDTGKSIHEDDKTLLDFNKSGVPLIEIVTEPDFTTSQEVTIFAKRLRQIVRFAGISDADMEKGQMRFELNISLVEAGQSKFELPDYKIEVKNIGSISVLQKVIEFEIKRQAEILEAGEVPVQETRGLKDMSGETLQQRIKEGSADYRYFPEPDIPPMRFDNDLIETIRSTIPELPQDKKARYINDYKLETDTAETIVSFKPLFTFFEQGMKSMKDKSLAQDFANWLIGDLRRLAKKHNVSVDESKVKPEYLVELVELLKSGKLSGSIAKDVLTESFNSGKAPSVIVEEKSLGVIGDTDELEDIVKKVIDANPKIVDDYKNKNENAIKFLIGQVMRETRGQADPIVAKQLLEKLLN